MRGKIMSGILTFLSLFILLGVVLTAVMLFNIDNRDIIDVKISENGEETVKFESLSMVPGKETEYTVLLYSEIEGKCRVSLTFEKGEKCELENYVYAVVEAETGVVCDMLLAELFEAGEICFDCEFVGKEPAEVNITYYMPENVGNEAQDSEAAFELVISVSNE